MIQAIVNNKIEQVIENESNGTGEESILLNGNKRNFNIHSDNNGSYHVLFENKSYRVEAVEVDLRNKNFKLKINGNVYNVLLKDENDLLLEKLGMSKLSKGKVKSLKAPMPGLVLDVLVKPGDEVKEGDSLVILEAMKMENALKASSSLTVKNINVEKSQTVEKGEVLVSFE